MNRDRRSSWLAAAILKQPRGHVDLASFVTTAQRTHLPVGPHQHHVSIAELEIHSITSMQASLVANRLRDHNLALFTNAHSHTRQV